MSNRLKLIYTKLSEVKFLHMKSLIQLWINEGLLNSRPICELLSDPSEPTALTPNHFLNITPLKFLTAEEIDLVLSVSRLDNRQRKYGEKAGHQPVARKNYVLPSIYNI